MLQVEFILIRKKYCTKGSINMLKKVLESFWSLTLIFEFEIGLTHYLQERDVILYYVSTTLLSYIKKPLNNQVLNLVSISIYSMK